jgi:hypothetical protein
MERTWFLVGLKDGGNGGRAVVYGHRLPPAMKAHLYASLKGKREDLVQGFLEGCVIGVLDAQWREGTVTAQEARKAREEYESLKQQLEEALDRVPVLEAQLDEAAQRLVKTHGTSPIELFGERHHPSYQRATGRVYYLPTRGGRKKGT